MTCPWDLDHSLSLIPHRTLVLPPSKPLISQSVPSLAHRNWADARDTGRGLRDPCAGVGRGIRPEGSREELQLVVRGNYGDIHQLELGQARAVYKVWACQSVNIISCIWAKPMLFKWLESPRMAPCRGCHAQPPPHAPYQHFSPLCLF